MEFSLDANYSVIDWRAYVSQATDCNHWQPLAIKAGNFNEVPGFLVVTAEWPSGIYGWTSS